MCTTCMGGKQRQIVLARKLANEFKEDYCIYKRQYNDTYGCVPCAVAIAGKFDIVETIQAV